MEKEYRIGELAEKAGVTRRTVHYYISKGLIPPAHGTGLASTYDDDHLLRIQLIKKLQESFLPLDKIRETITGLSKEEVKRRLDDREEMDPKELLPKVRENLPGEAYVKITLGRGLELYYPQSVQEELGDVILQIKKYVDRLLEEK